MICRVTVVIVMFVTAAACQSTQSGHFYWSETKAHELDYKHTVATAEELSAAERKNLLAFILNRFRSKPNAHDAEMFEGIGDAQLRKLAADTRLEFVDLNADGKKEVIAQGNGIGPCGATGNCIVLVLQSTPQGWKTLLDTHAQLDGGFEKIRVLESSTNGYRDVVLAAHVSACERQASVVAYNNNEYRERACYSINWCTAGGSELLPKPEIATCPK